MLTNLERDEARRSIEGYVPTWLNEGNDVCFADILRAKHSGNDQLVTTLSLQLALRGFRPELGESFAIVSGPITWLPRHTQYSLNRLQTSWTTASGTERTTLYVVAGDLPLVDTRRLGGSWLVFGDQDRVQVVRGGESERVGYYSVETVVAAVARALGAEQVRVEKRPEGWMEGLLYQAWQRNGGHLAEVKLPMEGERA